jgi:hypothetical protein
LLQLLLLLLLLLNVLFLDLLLLLNVLCLDLLLLLMNMLLLDLLLLLLLLLNVLLTLLLFGHRVVRLQRVPIEPGGLKLPHSLFDLLQGQEGQSVLLLGSRFPTQSAHRPGAGAAPLSGLHAERLGRPRRLEQRLRGHSEAASVGEVLALQDGRRRRHIVPVSGHGLRQDGEHLVGEAAGRDVCALPGLTHHVRGRLENNKTACLEGPLFQEFKEQGHS